MTQTLRVALDLLAEARRRNWVLGLFFGVTLLLLNFGLFLRLEVVDGMLEGSKLFGATLLDFTVSAERMFSLLYYALGLISFYSGCFLLGISCMDFAPELLAPGRIEHLLSLPVARWQLLLGTYLGVCLLALGSFMYGAGGLTLMVGVKTGLWNIHLFQCALVIWVAFCTLYSVALLSNFVVRGASLSGGVFVTVFVFGVVASYQQSLAMMFESGLGRRLFVLTVAPFPRFGQLANAAANLAAGRVLVPGQLERHCLACAVFTLAALALALWRFEEKDF
jgi:Cu-processing system permease protein